MSFPLAVSILDSHGNLLTSDKAIENRALEVYSNRLKPNKMEEHLEEYEADTNELCMLRLKNCKKNKTAPWTEEDLNAVLKQLKKDKSRDAMGYANELFTLSVAGSDMVLALLKLLNRIKDEQQFPKAFEDCTASRPAATRLVS